MPFTFYCRANQFISRIRTAVML